MATPGSDGWLETHEIHERLDILVETSSTAASTSLLVILGAAMTIGSGVGVLRAAGNPEEPRSSWASVGIGALVLVVLLIALAMADRWATG